MSVIAVVPARGGSKGIPNKNIAPVGGRPLIAWTIDAALAARRVDRVVVSTDSERIAETARACGAEVPFLRPPELARDDTPGMAPIIHAVKTLQAAGSPLPEYVVCLQPTSPFRTAADIDDSIDLATRMGSDAVVSVTPVHHHPAWLRLIDGDGWIRRLPGSTDTAARRQDLPPVYALNGAVFLVRTTVLLASGTWETDRTAAYVMPHERSVDIDTPWDLRVADALLRCGQPGRQVT